MKNLLSIIILLIFISCADNQNKLKVMEINGRKSDIPEGWGIKLDKINKQSLFSSGFLITSDTAIMRFRQNESWDKPFLDSAKYELMLSDTIADLVYNLSRRTSNFKRKTITIENLNFGDSNSHYYEFIGRELSRFNEKEIVDFYHLLQD
jgi:hypothetical protein